MAVRLREITADNFVEAMRLKVRPEQDGFVASSAASILAGPVLPARDRAAGSAVLAAPALETARVVVAFEVRGDLHGVATNFGDHALDGHRLAERDLHRATETPLAEMPHEGIAGQELEDAGDRCSRDVPRDEVDRPRAGIVRQIRHEDADSRTPGLSVVSRLGRDEKSAALADIRGGPVEGVAVSLPRFLRSQASFGFACNPPHGTRDKPLPSGALHLDRRRGEDGERALRDVRTQLGDVACRDHFEVGSVDRRGEKKGRED